MKLFLSVFFAFLTVINLRAQDSNRWFHLEGVSNPHYNVYLDKNTLDYDPGVAIIVTLKYEYINPDGMQTSLHRIEFDVAKDTYGELSRTEISKFDTTHIVKLFTPLHIIPVSEMSIIYQGVYIQAVIIGPTRKQSEMKTEQ